jgi:Spy/CpxP family protein refolding chaperone
MLRELNLSETQREEVREILDEHRAAAEKYREAHKAEFEALRAKAAKAREAGDREAMKAVHEEFKALMEKGPGGPDKALAEVKEVLTAEQAAKLEQMMAKMRERRGDGPGARGDGERPKRGEGEKGGEGKRPKRDQ